MSASSGSVLVHQHKPPVGLAGDDVPCCGVPLNADATASGARCCVPVAGLSGIDATSGIAGLSSVCQWQDFLGQMPHQALLGSVLCATDFLG